MELVKALALVGAVLIDPEARARAEATLPDTSAATPGSEAGSDGRGEQTGRPTAATRATVPPPPRSRTVRAARAAPGPAPPSNAARWSAVVGAGLHIQYGVAPNLTLGPRLTAGLRRWAASQRYALEARLSATRTWSAEIERDVGDARMGWTAGRAEVCALVQADPGAAVAPCATMEVGEITSTGSRARGATTRRALWAAPGGLLRAEIRLVGPLAVLVEAAATRPLVRAHFYFDRAVQSAPDDVVYDVPAAAFGAGFGLGAQFP
jgi:hypothetical protein